MLRSLAVLLAWLIFAFAAQPVAAEPMPLMLLWESPSADDPAGAWPRGLRVVIYDDGLVLKLVRAATASTEAQVVMGHVSAHGAKHRAAQTVALLSNAPRPEDIKADFPELRYTVLDVWDAQRKDDVRWAVVGHPCASLDGSALPPLDQQVRGALDERFRSACDMLARTMVPDAVEWLPQAIWIDLTPAEDGSDGIAPWPADWPERISYSRDAVVCVDRRAATEQATLKLASTDKTVREAALGLSVKSQDGTIWRIAGVRYALPAPVYYHERGSDTYTSYTIADGPCRHP